MIDRDEQTRRLRDALIAVAVASGHDKAVIGTALMSAAIAYSQCECGVDKPGLHSLVDLLMVGRLTSGVPS